MSDVVEVTERGTVLAFSYDDLLRYAGPHSPGGVAIGFRALGCALPRLGPVERREIAVATSFRGPGARDAFELVTRAVTGGRYTVDPALATPEHGRFVFDVGGVRIGLRPRVVTEEFLALADAPERDAGQEARLSTLKLELAERVLARAPGELFDLL